MKETPFKNVRFIMILVIFLGVMGLFLSMPRISFPIFAAYVFSLIFQTLLNLMRGMGLRKNFSVTLILIITGGLLVLPFFKLVPLLKAESENFQYYIPKVQLYIQTHVESIIRVLEDRTGLKLAEKLPNLNLSILNADFTDIVLTSSNYLAIFFEWMFLTPIFLFFILKDGRNFRNLILNMIPNQFLERFYSLLFQFNRKLGDYMFAKFIEAALVGTIITSGLFLLGMPFTLLIGSFAAFTNIIPYVGPLLGFAPAIVVCLIEFGFGPKLGMVVALFTMANLIDMIIVFPILVSKIVNLHPVVVIISVIIGSQYFGILGMILSVPAAAMLKLLLGEIVKEFSPEIASKNG